MKKFELALETEKEFFGIKMFRIRALISFKYVDKDSLGGYVQRENNLSQSGNAWVYGDAQVYGNARVCGDAQVYGNAWVHGNARVSGNTRVFGNARVYGNAWVHGNTWVYGNAQVYGNARVYGNTQVYGNAEVSGNARVSKSYQSCSITNLRFTFTSLPKSVQVGCESYSMKDWKEKYLELGEKNGMTKELSSAYYELMKSIRKIQRIESKLNTNK